MVKKKLAEGKYNGFEKVYNIYTKRKKEKVSISDIPDCVFGPGMIQTLSGGGVDDKMEDERQTEIEIEEKKSNQSEKVEFPKVPAELSVDENPKSKSFTLSFLMSFSKKLKEIEEKDGKLNINEAVGYAFADEMENILKDISSNGSVQLGQLKNEFSLKKMDAMVFWEKELLSFKIIKGTMDENHKKMIGDIEKEKELKYVSRIGSFVITCNFGGFINHHVVDMSNINLLEYFQNDKVATLNGGIVVGVKPKEKNGEDEDEDEDKSLSEHVFLVTSKFENEIMVQFKFKLSFSVGFPFENDPRWLEMKFVTDYTEKVQLESKLKFWKVSKVHVFPDKKRDLAFLEFENKIDPFRGIGRKIIRIPMTLPDDERKKVIHISYPSSIGDQSIERLIFFPSTLFLLLKECRGLDDWNKFMVNIVCGSGEYFMKRIFSCVKKFMLLVNMVNNPNPNQTNGDFNIEFDKESGGEGISLSNEAKCIELAFRHLFEGIVGRYSDDIVVEVKKKIKSLFDDLYLPFMNVGTVVGKEDKNFLNTIEEQNYIEFMCKNLKGIKLEADEEKSLKMK